MPAHPHRPPFKRLNPVFVIDERPYVMHTQLMLAVPASALKRRIANVVAHRDEITTALDLLFQGF